jgi:2OG-Fe(II) oxygenase superfamily
MNFLERLQTNLTKRARALDEDSPLFAFLQKYKQVQINKHPFRHCVIDSFFPESMYGEVVKHFQSIKSKGFATTGDAGRFAPFTDVAYPYDGYVYAPRYDDTEKRSAMNFFFGYTLNLFVSKLFSLHTSIATEVALHYHPPHNKSGWVHNDFVDKQFHVSNHTSSGVLLPIKGSFPDGNGYHKLRRTIALIYYIDNDAYTDGAGGGTGLYKNPKENPTTIVEPLSNRFLAFEVSPESYHAFLQNTFNRSTIVQWFHSDPHYREQQFKR